jgi:hypothetical protein
LLVSHDVTYASWIELGPGPPAAAADKHLVSVPALIVTYQPPNVRLAWTKLCGTTYVPSPGLLSVAVLKRESDHGASRNVDSPRRGERGVVTEVGTALEA